MEGTKFSDQIVVANMKVATFAFELNVLWFTAQHGVFEYAIACAESSKAFDHCMRTDFTTVANLDVGLEYSKRSNLHVSSEFRGWINQSSLMDPHKSCGMLSNLRGGKVEGEKLKPPVIISPSSMEKRH